MNDGVDIEASIRAVIACALPSLYIDSVEDISSGTRHALYRVKNLSDPNVVFEFRYQDFLPPITADHHAVIAKASLLQWIDNTANSPLVFDETSENESSSPESESQLVLYAKLIQPFSGRLLEHGSMQLPHYTPYNLVASPDGILFEEYIRLHGDANTESIKFQIGQLIRRMSMLKSPTARFGSVRHILPSVPCRNHWMRHNVAAVTNGETYSDWSGAFMALMHDIIRDIERLGIVASIHRVEQHLDRFKYSLSGVHDARLVIIDAGSQSSTLLQTDTSGEAPKVIGLREWGGAIFGDPLFAAMFSDMQAEDVWKGYNTPLGSEEPELGWHSNVIPTRGRLAIRLHLYQMYHGLAKIIKGICSGEDGEREIQMDGRRKLMSGMRNLDAIVKDAKSSREPPLLPAKPAKRHKLNTPRNCG